MTADQDREGIENLKFVEVGERIHSLYRLLDDERTHRARLEKNVADARELLADRYETIRDLEEKFAVVERAKLDAEKLLRAREHQVEEMANGELLRMLARAEKLEKELAASREQVFGLMALKVEVATNTEQETAALLISTDILGRERDGWKERSRKVEAELAVAEAELAQVKEELRKRQAEMIELRADLSHADLEAREYAIAHQWYLPRSGKVTTALDILGHDRDVWKERAEQAAHHASENLKETERMAGELDALRLEYADACFKGTARRPLKRCKHPRIRFGSSGWIVFCPDCSASWQAQESVQEACQSSPETEGDRCSERVRRGAP
jgi:hypothetical protein